MQIVSLGDNLHEMSNPILSRKNIMNYKFIISFVELARQVVKFNVRCLDEES